MSPSSRRRHSLVFAARAMLGLCLASLAAFLTLSQALRGFLHEIAVAIGRLAG